MPTVFKPTIPKNAVPVYASGGRAGRAIIGYTIGNQTYNANMQPTNQAAKNAVYVANLPGPGGGTGFLGGIFEPVAKAATNVLQPVEKTVNYIAANPDAQAAIAMAVAVPYVGQYIGGQLMAAGALTTAEAASAAAIAEGATAAQAAAAAQAATATATIIGTAIASTTAQVAQGVPFEEASKNALINAGVNQLAPVEAAKLNTVINSPAVTNAIISTANSGLSTALRGGSQDDVTKAMVAGLAGSTASSVYSEAAGVPTDSTSARIAGTVAKEAALDKTPEQIILTLIQQEGGKAVGDYLTKTPDQSEAETARLASKEATLSGSTKGAYLPETTPVMPDQTPAETARLQRQEAQIAGSTKGAYLPSASEETPAPVEEPRQGAYLPDAATDASATDTTTTDGLYKPSIFTATVATKPKASGATTQVLSQALGTTTGLTALRDAGEIETKRSGKPRKNVWNEESLKLKDALGV